MELQLKNSNLSKVLTCILTSYLRGAPILPSPRTNTAKAARAAQLVTHRVDAVPTQDGQRDDKCRRNGQCEAGHNRRHQRGLAKGVRSKASRCCHVSGLRRPCPLPRRLSLPTRARNGAHDAHRSKASGRHRQPVHRDQGRWLAQPSPSLAAVLSVLRPPASCPTSMCRPRLPAERAPHRRLAHVRQGGALLPPPDQAGAARLMGTRPRRRTPP